MGRVKQRPCVGRGGDVTPLQAMLKNLAVIIRKADEMLKSDVPIDDRNHLAVRKMLREIASSVAPYCHPRLFIVTSLNSTRRRKRLSRNGDGPSIDAIPRKLVLETVDQAKCEAPPHGRCKIEGHPRNLVLPVNKVMRHDPTRGRVTETLEWT